MFYLFNSQSKEQFGPFSKAEIANQIGTFTPDLHVFLFVWSAGWPNWKSLQDFQQGQEIQSVGSASTGADDTDLVREDSALIRHIPSSEINKRKFTRFAYRMNCTIKSSGTIFETHSVDISLGGIQLENALPSQMLKEKCTVEIHGPEGVGKVSFTLNLAAREEAKFFFFSNFVPDEIKTLERWLTALSNTTIKRPRLSSSG